MTYGSLVYWGCTRGGFMDIFNCARTAEYLRRHYPGYGYRQACCDPGVEQWMDSPTVAPPYTNPADDLAWWYDENRPESAGFLGFQVVSWKGMFAHSSKRTVNQVQNGSCSSRLLYGDLQDSGRVIVVEALAYGLSCCSTAYGINALTRTLRGCCSDGCGGVSMRLLSCVPEDTVSCDSSWEPPSGFVDPYRTLHNVGVIDEPEIVGVSGNVACACACSPVTRVQFTIQAGPGLFLEPQTFLPVTPIIAEGAEGCVVFCDTTVCSDNILLDPLCPTPIMPQPLDASPDCYCPVPFGRRQVFEVDLGAGRMFDAQLEMQVCAGSLPLRNLRVQIWRAESGIPFETGYYNNCNTCADFGLSYVPAGGCWTMDACSGVTVSINSQVFEASNTLYTGIAPGNSCILLGCGINYVAVTADLDTAVDATITMATVEIEP